MTLKAKKDDLPPNHIVARELLRHLYLRAKPVTPQELYRPLANALKISAYQLSLTRATSNSSKWENRVQAAREHLAVKGFIKRGLHGYWSLTQSGIAEAAMYEKFREIDDEIGLAGE